MGRRFGHLVSSSFSGTHDMSQYTLSSHGSCIFSLMAAAPCVHLLLARKENGGTSCAALLARLCWVHLSYRTGSRFESLRA